MLSRFKKIQLIVFAFVSVAAVLVLGLYYLRLPALAGAGQYTLHTNLPRSGGLYATANVTYDGVTVGEVTSVKPTRQGVRATMRIASRYRVPVDARANVHSVSALGEQYLDLVSPDSPDRYLTDGQTIATGSVPSEIGPALDAVNNSLAALPQGKVTALLDETSQAVGGLGPSLHRLVDSTQAVVGDIKTNIADVNDIIDHSAPILDSQVTSRDTIPTWMANLNSLATQSAAHDPAVRSILQQAAPTAAAATQVFRDVGDALPQAVANAAIVLDMLKRYYPNVEQTLVVLPQLASAAQAVLAPDPEHALLDFNFSVNQPPPCLTGFLPASEWRSPADTSTAPIPDNVYCKIPKDTPANVVRGARNYPCVDVPGKRAATPRECRSDEPYTPLGTNPWYGDPNQIVSCPAPAARCDSPPKPGAVIPAPSIVNGMNPLPADQLPGATPPHSDPLAPPGSGTVQCTGQQPAPCSYTPASSNAAAYDPSGGVVVGPDGTRYAIRDSADLGDSGWKTMLAPAPSSGIP